MLDASQVKAAAAGRWPEIIESIGCVGRETLDGRHHPCPKCGGKDRFRVFGDFGRTGGMFCNQCFNKKNGDGLAALQWLIGGTFPEMVARVGEYLGISNGRANGGLMGRNGHPDIVAEIARRKRIPLEEIRAFGATEAQRGKLAVCRVPMFDEHGRQCADFDLATIDQNWLKGLIGRRQTHGVFLRDGKTPTPGEAVHLVEGVKDAAALSSTGRIVVGLPTSSMAAGFARLFRGCHVIVIPDRDQDGERGARQTCARLAGFAASVRLAMLPGELKMSDGDGIREVLAQRNGEEKLNQAIEDAVEWQPEQLTKPEIDAGSEDLKTLTAAAWSALEYANALPTIFRFGDAPCRIESDDHGQLIIRGLTIDRMRHHLARSAVWYKVKSSGEVAVRKPSAPPKDVVKDVLATPNPPLPILTRIVRSPVFAADGTLNVTPGYCPASRTYYAPAKGFAVPDVSQKPSDEELREAIKLLKNEMLVDFPFVSHSERAHCISLILLPFARDFIDGPTPLHLVEAPSPGSGKTLLVQASMLPALGTVAPAMTEGGGEDEWRKRIFAKLRSGPAATFIDNLRAELNSSALASAITAWPFWEDRVLMTSGISAVPVRTCWIATGNNPSVSAEMARRIVRIRLNPRIDRPWLRNGFRHPDILAWCRRNRGRLCWAALTLIQSWLSAGRSEGNQTLGMFESWSRVMGGILKHAGIEGFLRNINEFYDAADAIGADWQLFIGSWWDRFGQHDVQVSELSPLADGRLQLGDGSEQSRKIRLGKKLSAARDQVVTLISDRGDVRVTVQQSGTRNRAKLWKLSDNTHENKPTLTHSHGDTHTGIRNDGNDLERDMSVNES